MFFQTKCKFNAQNKRHNSGATAIEYGIIIAFIAVLCIGIIAAIGLKNKDNFEEIRSAIGSSADINSLLGLFGFDYDYYMDSIITASQASFYGLPEADAQLILAEAMNELSAETEGNFALIHDLYAIDPPMGAPSYDAPYGDFLFFLEGDMGSVWVNPLLGLVTNDAGIYPMSSVFEGSTTHSLAMPYATNTMPSFTSSNLVSTSTPAQ